MMHQHQAILHTKDPTSPDLEKDFLGAILKDPDSARISEVRLILSPEEFSVKAHQIIYQEIVELTNNGDKFDAVILSEHLKDKGLLKKVGGSSFLADLIDLVPSAALAPDYAQRLCQLLRDRKIQRVAYSLYQDPRNKGLREKLREELTESQVESDRSVRPLGVIPAPKDFWDYVSDETEKPPDLVETILPVESMLLIYSSPGVGKTIFTLNLAVYLTAGKPFHGWNIQHPLKVLYFLAEGGYYHARSRVKAMASNYHDVKVPAESLYLFPVRPFDVEDPLDFALLENAIADVTPQVIVIDPFLKSHHVDENDNVQMQGVLDRFRNLIVAKNRALVLIHHANKIGLERGASAIKAECDTLIKMAWIDPNEGTRKIEFEKLRHGQSPPPFAVRVNPHSLFFERIDLTRKSENIDLLMGYFVNGQGYSKSVLKKKFMEDSGKSYSTFYSTFNQAQGKLEKRGQKWYEKQPEIPF